MNKDLSRILVSADKRAGETNHLLARLLRQVMADLAISPIEWNELINRYYRSRYSRTRKNARDIASDKNNFNRAIAKEQVSWRNLFKAICIFGPKSIKLTIEFEWSNGKSTTHHVKTSNPMADLVENTEKSEEGDGDE